MNKTLLLVLVTIVQSQSDGTLLSTNQILPDSLDDNHNGLYLEDIEDLEYPPVSAPSDDGEDENSRLQKRSHVDPLTRRSALDKNFMRFGRSGFFPDESNSKLKNLMRFLSENDPILLSARSPNNNFLRFGRGQKDNFIRFGRGAKENFIRFGRGINDNFMRFGRSSKDIIRPGRLDKNFMRFGRSEYEDPDLSDDLYQRLIKSSSNFLRFGKSPKSSTNFIRYGKSPGKADSFIRFGRSSNNLNRNSTNFLRFGRDDPTQNKDPAGSEVDEVTDPDVDLGDLDLNGEKLKNGPIIRIKRKANNEKSKNNHENGFIRYGRDAEIMEEIPKLRNNESGLGDDDVSSPRNDVKRSTDNFDTSKEDMLKSVSHILSDLRNAPSFEGESVRPLRLYSGVSSGFPNLLLAPEFSILPQGSGSKRNQGGSNFIRFG